ncbi:dehydrogenase/reductase SDR family member on chromosome X-like [Gouania willdenowi]|uniref:Dehydrogenase/reductase SDR family member on chromosome X-like n=1 Tax=Gouania willdenowi TaxID=441366 RepID=A0A8C5I2Z0_GOUWI|nr:dehydrogenase/reductase SDR family member on chromosome X-like [Gouania willdenowi]XP_028291551.1 dehydrogenase/reductase SDR family member on chromosome X-like [Gouania willdenowi]
MCSVLWFQLLSLIKLYLLGFKVLVVQLLNGPVRLPELPRQDGKVVIVTGGTKGIGYEVVRHMVSLGAHVIIGGRNEQEGIGAVRRIREQCREAKVEFRKLDLASLESVRLFAQRFKKQDLPLDVLINNAGVMLVPGGRTDDGFEPHFGINYLGHFLLTWLLLDKLKNSGNCGSNARVVNVSSSAHSLGEIWLNDLNSCQCYSAHAAYCQSKLAQVLFSSHLHLEMQRGGFPVSSCAVDPGMVDTGLYSHLWTPLRLAQSVIARLFFRSPAEGAATVLSAALSPATDGGGYWANGHKQRTPPVTLDPKLQLSLWEVSLQLLGL